MHRISTNRMQHPSVSLSSLRQSSLTLTMRARGATMGDGRGDDVVPQRLQVLWLLLVVARGAAAGEATEAVRRDWYFRESLTAIRDWEAVLAAWETETPAKERTPVFPVPSSGEAVDWPNPIPLMLLPAGDVGRRVRLRLIDGSVEVQRRGGQQSAVATVAPGTSVLGYKHPGGGGKSRWYHRYHRRFDGMTHFRPVPAPFHLRLEAPLDLRRGENVRLATIRNVGGDARRFDIRLTLHTPKGKRLCARRELSLAGSSGVRLPITLEDQGGGLLILDIRVGEQRWWLPLFTHVEAFSAVLRSIEQVLADTPDADAARRLAALRQGGGAWRERFEAASRLRDELLLLRIGFEAMLFVKRKPYTSEQPFMDAHHCVNPPGGAIYRLSPVRPDGRALPIVGALGHGIYRDLCLHWDADRFLFAFGNGSDRGPKLPGPKQYDIFEARVDGTQVRRLTTHPKNDAEPLYLPGGGIAFTSDRADHVVMCGSNIHAPVLHVMGADGSNPRQLSFNVFNDINPCLMPDGRILYTRWEYNERSVTTPHKPFTMNPDGSMVEVCYGNATIRPNVVMFPRPVPGSHKIMGLFTAHHGQTHGPIALIDTRRGLDGPEPYTLLTPGVPVTGERAMDSRFGWFSDPVPLSETSYLCSFTPTVLPWLESSWAIYVGDRHGNLALVYRAPDISCFEPVPLVRRPRPFARPGPTPDTHASDAEATLLVLDTHIGLPGVRRGTAKFLRILEDVPRKGVPEGGVIVTSGTGIYTVKRILGTVPVEADGSAHFAVPANRNVYFEALDARHREIQRMRSVVCLKPGERRACVGCHEPRTTSPPNGLPTAAGRPPSRPEPPPWGSNAHAYLRDIQPLVNSKCAHCHTHDRTTNGVILTDDLTQQFCIAYEELLPYLSVANAMRWDHPDDVYPRPPYTYGSGASRLTKLLDAGHHDVELSDEEWRRLFIWIDANAVYYDRYEHVHPQRHLFPDAIRKRMAGVHGRRCARCHGRDDGRRDTWWLSYNRRDLRLSRSLVAPLARKAGGWGRCDETVFADTDDPDYRALLAALTNLRGHLAKRPRADLLSIRGTPAETQPVTLPPPPPPRHAPRDELPEGWVWLSDLKWETATAGWTCTGDKLPRLDRDVEDKRLRAGRRRYRKGIGTHAPSEIAYPLDGKYARFHAIVCGAEAKGTVVFQVWADGKRLHDSGTLRGLEGTKTVDLPLAGARRLRLVVTIAGDTYTCDMANWAGARLLKAER